MVVVKCVHCGSEFEFDENMMLAECPYCGTQQSPTDINSEIVINSDNEIYPISNAEEKCNKKENKKSNKKSIALIMLIAAVCLAICAIIGIKFKLIGAGV